MQSDTADRAKIRVLVADEDRLARIALVCLLGRLTGVEVAGEVAGMPTGRALDRAVAEHRADVVICRFVSREPPPQTPDPPGGSGGEVRFSTSVRSDTESPEDVHTAFAAGARAFLVESRAPDHLAAALEAVTNGGRFLDPELGARFAADGAHDGRPARGAVTRRERQVLALLASGRTNDEIAAALGISTRTVEGHRTRLGRKLGLRRRTELVEYALRHRLRSAPPSTEPAGRA
jgi:DNA-binding NarL/FixJ family response regulator